MLRILCFIFISNIFFSESVDRSNFKTCSQSSFCKRQRDFQPIIDDCTVNPDTVVVLKSSILCEIYCKKDNAYFIMDIIKLKGHVFQLKIKEKNPLRERFEPGIGDVLVKEPIRNEFHISRDPENNVILIKGLDDEKAILYLKPFKLDMYLKDVPLISVNSRNLFKFESTRIKTQKPSETNPEGTPNSTDGESNPENHENSEDAGSWSEQFKSHTDSKPYGPTSVGLDISLPGFQYVYGIPEHADKFALRNTDNSDPYRLYNLDVFEYELNNQMALYGSVPLMWAHNGNQTAGIFWNNPTETWIDVYSSLESLNTFNKILNFVKRTDVNARVDTHWMSEGGVIDVFLLMADSPAQAFQYYGELTGTTPLPPLFSLGYHQCRWNYNDQKDVENVDKLMDEHDLPYDVIWLDIEHTDDKKYFTWDKIRFPDPNDMINKLEVKSRKLVTVIDPHVKRVSGWSLYEDGLTSDVFVKRVDRSTVYEGWCWPGSSVWPDFIDVRVREWYSKQFLTYEGSRANNTFTWNDMGEPSVFSGPEITMEKDAIHMGVWEHREVHNLYGLQVHRSSWEGQLLRSDNKERPFLLTRAFFAGSQRFGAVWNGDNTASWGHLKITTPMLLSFSVTGLTFCGADVGGFFGNPDHELLTRWYQAGAFHPFYRAHAHLDTKRREPYLLPSDNVRIIRNSLQERYKLLPYWYTLFYESESSNAPVMSPMWFFFPSDVKNFNIDDQFMVGPAILVKPITDPGTTSTDVYLPPALWYLHSGWKQYDGGQTVTLPVNINNIPVFYRGGVIVPRKERVRRSSYLGRFDPYTFLVFLNHEQTASGSLYIDDLHSMLYKTEKQFEYYSILFQNFQLVVNNANEKSNPILVGSKLERVVICGLRMKPTKIILTDKTEKTNEMEFFYMSERLLLVIRNPGVTIGDKWNIQLEYEKQEL